MLGAVPKINWTNENNFIVFFCCRSLGRRPSEDKVSLYVRKGSNDITKTEDAVKLREKKDVRKKNQFLEDMARKSLEVPTDFLDKLGKDEKSKKVDDIIPKKYPFNRTTTPNTLREHLKETLAKNLGSCTDLADTIHALQDDEILDTFNIDSENIETPPIQRRAFRHKSLRLPSQDNDNESDIGSDFASRRKNHKFRTLAGDGKPLGDRELVIKKKKESNTDLSEGRRAATDLEDDLGSGLFDRFSSARKTLGRNSTRRKNEEDEISLDDSEKKQKGDNWRAKIANKFRKSSDSYDFVEAEKGQQLREYLGQVTPMSEPIRRKPLNLDSNTTSEANNSLDRNNRTQSRVELEREAKNRLESKSRTNSRQESKLSSDRKSSYIMPGDYDSALVDGKYVTSVPIINVEEVTEPDSGNIRPGHSLKDLKKPDNRRNSLIERLSRTGSTPRDTPKSSGSNVFDRLAGGGKSGSRTSLSSSRPSLTNDTRASTSSLTGRGTVRSTNNAGDKSKGTFNIIRDISKNLRKGKEDSGPANLSTVVRPRNSQTLFSSSDRKPMSNLNGGSHVSINSSTRSINKASTGRESPKLGRTPISSTIRTTSKPSITSSIRSTRPTTNLNNNVRNGTNNKPTFTRATSSKENLSRSSSSASRSSVTNSNGMSRNGSLRTGVTTPGSIPATARNNTTTRGSSTLPATRRAAQNTGMSFMKPTTASAKKVLGPTSSTDSLRRGVKPAAISTVSTSSRVSMMAGKPTRR